MSKKFKVGLKFHNNKEMNEFLEIYYQKGVKQTNKQWIDRIEKRIEYWDKPIPGRMKISPEIIEKLPSTDLIEFTKKLIIEELKELINKQKGEIK